MNEHRKIAYATSNIPKLEYSIEFTYFYGKNFLSEEVIDRILRTSNASIEVVRFLNQRAAIVKITSQSYAAICTFIAEAHLPNLPDDINKSEAQQALIERIEIKYPDIPDDIEVLEFLDYNKIIHIDDIDIRNGFDMIDQIMVDVPEKYDTQAREAIIESIEDQVEKWKHNFRNFKR